MPKQKYFSEAERLEAKREATRRWRLAHPDLVKRKCRESAKRGRERCPNRERVRKLWYKFGLTPEQYNDLYSKQEGRCAICLAAEQDIPKGRFHVDHDHSTDQVRGLLCSQCNALLGYAYDRLDLLHSAIAYLGRRE